MNLVVSKVIEKQIKSIFCASIAYLLLIIVVIAIRTYIKTLVTYYLRAVHFNVLTHFM